MGKWTEQFSKEVQMANNYVEKMFNIFSYQGNANWNYIEISSHTSQDSYYKENKQARCQWFTPVILATWKAEIGRVKIQGQPGQIVLKTPSPK
jgi:hypothetical protein